MFRRRHASLALRLAIGAATCWTLFLVGGYFLEYRTVRRHHLESALFIVAGLALALTATERHVAERTAAAGWPAWWIVWSSVLTAAILLYWPAFHLGFLSDDFVLARRAQEGEFVARTHEFVRPVPLIIWRVLLISGGGAVALHSLNVLLHAVNSALTAALARALGVRPGPALFAGLLFLVSVARFVLETRRSRSEAALVALGWSFSAAAPAVGYLFIGNHLDGSRYLYLPMAGWAIFLALSLEWVADRTRHRLPVVLCAVAALAMVTAQTRALLNDWTEAASLRDALLREGIRSADESGCVTAHFSDLPARHKGAQLFNNGMDQAVAQHRRSTASLERSTTCEFSWTGLRFLRRM